MPSEGRRRRRTPASSRTPPQNRVQQKLANHLGEHRQACFARTRRRKTRHTECHQDHQRVEASPGGVARVRHGAAGFLGRGRVRFDFYASSISVSFLRGLNHFLRPGQARRKGQNNWPAKQMRFHVMSQRAFGAGLPCGCARPAPGGDKKSCVDDLAVWRFLDRLDHRSAGRLDGHFRSSLGRKSTTTHARDTDRCALLRQTLHFRDRKR